MRTFSSFLPFTNRLELRRATCMTNGAEGGGGGGLPRIVCKECETIILRCENFCSECGTPVPESDKSTHPKVKSNIAEVRISFGYSTSNNYDWVVEICRKIPSYSETGEGRKIRHDVVFSVTDAKLALTIYNLAGGWSSFRMFIGNMRANRGVINTHGLECYRGWQQSYDPKRYCFGTNPYDENIWGCKYLRMSHRWHGWLNEGEMDDSGVWHIHKDETRHNLQIKAGQCKFCPVFDRNRVFQTLEEVAHINPQVDPKWEYKTTDVWDEERGEYRKIKVGVQPASSN